MPVELGLALIWYVVFAASTTFHEAAHGFVALRLGDPTARDAGLVSLDPVPHIRRSPVGMVVIPLLSFLMGGWMIGWASTPYDAYWAHRHRRAAAWMALAGPAANLALVLLAALLVRGGILLGLFIEPPSVRWPAVTAAAAGGPAAGAAMVVSILFSLNLVLLVFNLLPLPPLDGSGVVVLFLDDHTAERYREFMAQPAVGMIGLIIAWNVMDLFLNRVHTLALNVLYPGAGYH